MKNIVGITNRNTWKNNNDIVLNYLWNLILNYISYLNIIYRIRIHSHNIMFSTILF